MNQILVKIRQSPTRRKLNKQKTSSEKEGKTQTRLREKTTKLPTTTTNDVTEKVNKIFPVIDKNLTRKDVDPNARKTKGKNQKKGKRRVNKGKTDH